MFPGSPEAAVALNWNTILYRLYIRAPSQPAYTASGRTLGAANLKYRDVSAVAVDPQDRVLLAHKNGLAVFDGKGTLVRSVNGDSPSAVALTFGGLPLQVRGNALIPEGALAIRLGLPQSDGKMKEIDEISAVLALSTGGWLVGDRKNKVVQMFSAEGKYEKAFVTTPVDRLVKSTLQDVAVLDRDAKQVSVFDWTGKSIGRVVARGTGYELTNPVDIAFDTLGHLYVLDRSKGAVLVFSSPTKLLTTFSIPEKSPGAFQKAVAFALDSAGRR